MNTLCLEFMNSEFRDFRGRWVRDDLQRQEWRTQFLSRWSLQVEAEPDASTMAELIELRTLLRSTVESTPHIQLSDQTLATLNALLRQVPSSYQITRAQEQYRLERVPQKSDWNWVKESIIVSFVRLLTQYDPQRLKACANAHCRWIFYDESKSRTRRYCSNDKCANLLKVRRFRARQKSHI